MHLLLPAGASCQFHTPLWKGGTFPQKAGTQKRPSPTLPSLTLPKCRAPQCGQGSGGQPAASVLGPFLPPAHAPLANVCPVCLKALPDLCSLSRYLSSGRFQHTTQACPYVGSWCCPPNHSQHQCSTRENESHGYKPWSDQSNCALKNLCKSLCVDEITIKRQKGKIPLCSQQVRELQTGTTEPAGLHPAGGPLREVGLRGQKG